MHTSYSHIEAFKPAQASSEASERKGLKAFSPSTYNAPTKMVYFGSIAAADSADSGGTREGFSMKTIIQALLNVGMFAGVVIGWLQFILLTLFVVAVLALGGVVLYQALV